MMTPKEAHDQNFIEQQSELHKNDTVILPYPALHVPLYSLNQNVTIDDIEDVFSIMTATMEDVSPLFCRTKEFTGPLTCLVTATVPEDRIARILLPVTNRTPSVPFNAIGYLNGATCIHVDHGTAVMLDTTSIVVMPTGIRHKYKIQFEGMPVRCDRGKMIQPNFTEQKLKEYVEWWKLLWRTTELPSICFCDFEGQRVTPKNPSDGVIEVSPINIITYPLTRDTKTIQYRLTAKYDKRGSLLEAATLSYYDKRDSDIIGSIHGITALHVAESEVRILPECTIEVRNIPDEPTCVGLTICSEMLYTRKDTDVTKYLTITGGAYSLWNWTI